MQWLESIRSAVFGLAARRAAWDYLRVTLLIVFILLAIAWAIDLTKSNFKWLRRDAQEQGIATIRLLAPYMTYRAADILARLLPVACFFGVFIAEFLRRARLQTVILQAAGASPLRLLGPVMLFGAVLGPVMYKLEADWRPAAVAAQVQTGQGAYARRFADGWVPGRRWFLYGDLAVRGQVFRAPDPAMRDVMIFRGLAGDRLREVLHGDRMEPADTPGMWRLTGVTRWGDDAEVTGQKMPDQLLPLPLIPEELQHYGKAGFYLDNAALAALRGAYPGSDAQISAEVATWRRATIWLMPFVLAALALSLMRYGYVGRQPHFPRLIALAVAGHVCVVSFKVFYAIAELGGLAAPAAVLMPMGLFALVVAVLTWRAS